MTSGLRKTLNIVVLIILVMTLCSCGKNERTEKELRKQAIGFMENGDYSAAVSRFNEALTYSRKTGALEIDILKYRAEAECLCGDYASAANTYAMLAREDGDKPEYADMQVISMVRSGEDPGKAYEIYCEVDNKGNESNLHRQALYELGKALAGSEKNSYVELAKELYTDALSDEGRKSGELYSRMGTMSFMAGDVDKAIEWYETGKKFIEEDNGQSGLDESDTLRVIKYNLAVCYEHKQEYSKAKNMFEEYRTQYGSDEKLEHELAFLESRIRTGE